jgi:hypothetical protein
MTQTTDMLKVQLGAAADSKSRTPFAPGDMFLGYVFASGSLTSLGVCTTRLAMVLALPGVPDVVRRRISAENLAHALLARVPEMSPNPHQQPTIATSSNLRT